MEEETTDQELQEYLDALKQKSGIKNLWTGEKFLKAVRNEEDKTPDISITSEEENANELEGKFWSWCIDNLQNICYSNCFDISTVCRSKPESIGSSLIQSWHFFDFTEMEQLWHCYPGISSKDKEKGSK